MTAPEQPEPVKPDSFNATMYDLFKSWCRDSGRDHKDSAAMKAFLADVFRRE